MSVDGAVRAPLGSGGHADLVGGPRRACSTLYGIQADADATRKLTARGSTA
ncbi:hypothetical protein ACWFNE_03440 [Cellulomonas sp. NPDC055163]